MGMPDKRPFSSEEGLPPMPVPEPGRSVVLVVDDHAWIRRIAREALSGDYVILEAANGLEALRYLKMVKVDLVLSDLVMPEMGGLALAQQMRDTCPGVPIAFVTAHLDEDSVSGAARLSPHYITKPFGVADLRQRVREILEGESGFAGSSS